MTTVLRLLYRELLATVGAIGATLTVLSKLKHVVPLPGWLVDFLTWWQSVTHAAWVIPIRQVHISLHPDFAAALSLALFALVLGVGTAVSAKLQGSYESAPRLREFVRIGGYLSKVDSWVFMIICAAIFLAFLIGQDRPAGTPKLSRNIDFLPAWIAIGALFCGLYVGRYAFFHRLRRVAAVVLLVLGSAVFVAQFPGGPKA